MLCLTLGMLTPAAAEPLWTLWRVEDGATPTRLKMGLERSECEWGRQYLERSVNVYVEIDHDIVQLRERPAARRWQFRCRPDGEGPE
jgi:hypothetical protein